jgi:hypothetical protein
MSKYSMSVINYYKRIGTGLNPRHKLKGGDKTGIEYAPFFLLISGRSNMGKTNALLNLLHLQNGSYDRVIICCQNLQADPLYVQMKKKNPSAVDVFEKQIPSVDAYQTPDVKLIIFDDMVGKKQFEAGIADWFTRGRKAGKGGCSMVYITQSFYHVEPIIRRNLSAVYLFPSSNKRELAMILKEFPFLDDWENVVDQYKRIKKPDDGPSSFMNINVDKSWACIDFDIPKNAD